MSTEEQRPQLPPWEAPSSQLSPEGQGRIMLPEGSFLEWEHGAVLPWGTHAFWTTWFATVRSRIQPAPPGTLAVDAQGRAFIRTRTGWRQISLL